MKIKANIDDKALVIEDFLEETFFKKLQNFNFNDCGATVSKNKWTEELLKDDYKNKIMQTVKSVDLFDIHNNITNTKLNTKDFNFFKSFLELILNCSFLPSSSKKISVAVAYYEYPKFSGINWHSDEGYTLNHSFYFHDKWNKNWGGETFIDSGRGLPLVTLPLSNHLLTIKSGVLHKVSSIVGPFPRKVLQVRCTFLK